MNGFVSANRATLLDTLTKESIILVPGGAAEALHSHPGVLKLHIQNRKGFIRLALDAKVPILPCIGFGESEIFDTVYVHNGMTVWEQWLWFVQQRSMRLLSFSVPIWTSVIPNKTKITVMLGAPIEFDENKSVDECHALYLRHLSKLYEKNKAKYGYDTVSLEFV
jgi:2-acylglycerol O-acyltransferase 2